MTTALTGVFDLGETPEDSELLNILKRQTMVAVRTNTIGKVLSFDPASSTATIEVQIPRIERDPNDPTRNITKPPFIIKNMPVVFPRSQQGFLTFPISPGDTGEILVQDRDPSKWLQSGSVVDPVSRFTHNLSFGVFHPGIQPDFTTQSNGPVDMTASVLDGQSQVKLGKNAQLGVARMSDKTSADTSMLAWIVQVQAALTTISAIIPVVLPTPPTDFGVISQASVKVKAE